MTSRKSPRASKPAESAFATIPTSSAFTRNLRGRAESPFSEYARRLAERGALAESVDQLIETVQTSIAKADTLLQEARRVSGTGTAAVSKSAMSALPVELVESIFSVNFS
jgi:hypothetical protein